MSVEATHSRSGDCCALQVLDQETAQFSFAAPVKIQVGCKTLPRVRDASLLAGTTSPGISSELQRIGMK